YGIAYAAGTDIKKPPILTEATENGLFTVELRLEGESLFVGRNYATLFISDGKKNAVTGARVGLLPVVTAHGDSTLLKPVVREKSDGLYSVEDLYIENEGNWTLRVTVKTGEISDTASFHFSNVKRRPQ
ncbi:MAG: hypothetical protein AB1442_17695, partial [Nitrospirota bacterium]